MPHNEKFIEEIPSVVQIFPNLRKLEVNNHSILYGSIDLFSADGQLIDSYEIEIHPKDNYPQSYPLLYEVGGRIPRNIDWHVYPEGHCCLAVPIEEVIDCANGINLSDFIKKQVCGFLFNQTFRRTNGYFYRERSHGILGSLEYYQELLKLSESTIFNGLSLIVGQSDLSKTAKCFCGSNRKYHKCHRPIIRFFKGDIKSLAKEDFKKIKMILNQQSKM